MNRTETRITSETGGEKGQKLAQLSSLDPHALIALAECSGLGAQKYSAHNYLRGYDWSLSFDAAQRHLLAFWGGEDLDPESGQQHLAHAAWHCLAMLSFVQRGIGSDTRPLGVVDDKPSPTIRWRDNVGIEWAQCNGEMFWFEPGSTDIKGNPSQRSFTDIMDAHGPLTPVTA